MCKTESPFHGKDIYVVGGGNSFDPKLASSLPLDRVVCINSTYQYFTNFLALFWMDSSWYRSHWKRFGELDIKHTYYISKDRPMTSKRGFKWLHLDNRGGYKANVRKCDTVVGNNTGCCVINYLDKMGAKKIYLLGFDCKKVKQRSHSHDHYNFTLGDNTYQKVFLPCFEELSKNIKNAEVINCYIGSAIKNFKYKKLTTILAEEASSANRKDV